MEQKAEIKTYKVDYVCDDCENGLMVRYGDEVLASHPPQYSHKCQSCGSKKYFNKTYPTIEYGR